MGMVNSYVVYATVMGWCFRITSILTGGYGKLQVTDVLAAGEQGLYIV